MHQIQRLTVIGVGLIGGSFALKLRELGLVQDVVGCGRNTDNLDKALELGVIDHAVTDPTVAVAGADLVLLAVPLGSIAPIYQQIQPFLAPNAVITDVGSAKASVINEIADLIGECPTQFVPGHPIAGREQSGVAAADNELFKAHRVILTPLEHTCPEALARVKALWQAVGAQVSEMTACYHDEVFAATSHLPHLLAFALVDMLNEHPELGNVFQYTAGGFRDFTRIASSDADMWRDIAVQNHHAIIKWLEAYQAELAKLAQLLTTQNGDELHQLFSAAKAARDKHIVNRTA
ncbi:prephenate dehydrogenase/arogenate dehydrogenase family protein [Thiomicrospira sp. ALE5]|uniref:prephenate dehydrogenase n=1 Tax=Thiomicrospira sp. ALE5 TaxID=748650 RepID=UPI0008E150F4|nr:prephenate dehydrogenase/arogenate dehydrogenase family protein [Thiomicrospira sp. ALE5]SFR49823.1 prephenate dehydrogenase [Thiomicrospira sp. ALE5]